MRILGLIGARGGSKGVPRKNLIDLAGNPLVSYTFSEAARSERLDRVVLSTDDPEIADLARSMNIEVPFMRPAHLATDTAVMSEVIRHALDQLKDKHNYVPDAVLLLQPTSPLRRVEHIDQAIHLYEKEAADGLVSLSHPQEHPWDMVSIDDGQIKFAFNRYKDLTNRQEYKRAYYINGAIYLTRIELFHRHGHFWSGRVLPYFMDTLDSIDVDTEADLIIADCLLSRRQKTVDCGQPVQAAKSTT